MTREMIATLQTLADRKARRRSFLAGALGLGAGAVGLAGTGRTALAQVSAANDMAILNFALNLEYLEAEYYTFAVTGGSIEALGIATTGANTGGGNPGAIAIKASPKVPFSSSAVAQYAAEIALDEQKHVTDLRGVLGAAAVARPAVDLMTSFAALGGMIGVPGFDPFSSDLNFLLGAYIFEDVGVTAYHGAAPLIQSKSVLDSAAGILAVEAEHAGLIRTNLFQMGQGALTQAISGVRASLGGSVDYGVAQGPLNMGPAGTSSVMLGDANAMAPSRSARQVLNIVYGGINVAAGLFFPLGLNGSIR